MEFGLVIFFLISCAVILMLLGVEVFATAGIVGVIGLVLFLGQPPRQLAYTAFEYLNSFVLTAIPLFVFMGTILAATGVVRSLFEAAEKWITFLPGGLISALIVVNAIFGSMCGASVAASATFGKITYPEMKRAGYSPRFALGAIAAGGALSVAIPPSNLLIVYGAWSDTSVVRLFAAVLIPGAILTLLFMLYVIMRVKLNPSIIPTTAEFTWSERLTSLRDLLPWLLIVAIVLGSIFGGIMTPTESASLGAALSVILALIYRRMSWAALKESMLTTLNVTSMFAFVIFTAKVLGQVFMQVGATERFSSFLLGLPFGKYGILAIIGVMYVIFAMFMDDFSILLLTIPFVLPVIQELGYSSVWFGVFYCMVGETGLITPPFGVNLFAIHSVVPEHDIMTIARGAIPYVVPMLIVGALIVAFPDQLVYWLPSVLFD